MISNSRLFWRRFTTWIRVYFISRYVGIGTEEEAFNRLYSETSGIGNFLQVIYELESSSNISGQFSQIIIALRNIITAQLQGNREAMTQGAESLYQNAENFASYLASINPYINESEWKTLMEDYVRYTIEEANSFVTGNYSNDIELFRRLTDLTDRMGDLFAKANFNYINSGGRVILPCDQPCITYDQMNQIYTVRMFWFELVTWIRAYMLSRFKGIGNESEIIAHLKHISDEYARAQRQIFGTEFEPTIQLINEYINLIEELITAQLEGNNEEVSRIVQLLYQNADQRAAAVASINPFWDENEWRNRLYSHVRATVDQSITFQTGDYSRNLDIFSTLLNQAESASGYFARGLYSFITS
jgi:hypothetical protein